MAEKRCLFRPEVEAQSPQSSAGVTNLKHMEALNTGLGAEEPCPKRREVHDFRDECFLLDGLLMEEEATYYMEVGEQLGFDIIHGTAPSYRNMKRVMVQSPSLAKLLWARVQPFLTDIHIEGDPHNVHIHGVNVLLQGTWKPLGLNDIFRLCKYSAGGHFAPHFDGHLMKSATVRSMKTLMLYLNGDFEGGTTNFIDESQLLYQDSTTGCYCAEMKNIICSVKPEAGLGIVFNHHRLHEGQATRAGLKYILRTDVLYQRVGGPDINDSDNAALLLVQEAERLEGDGQCMEAMAKYRQAFKMSASVAESFSS